MIKSVENTAEFNTLLPSLVFALNSNKSEWEYYHTLNDMLEMMNGNKHMLFYDGDIYAPLIIGFFIVEHYANGNAQVDLMWSWAKDELYVEGLVATAQALAHANGASRIRVNACRPLAKKLLRQEYTTRCIELIKDLG